MHMNPGLIVLHSGDLVNWEPATTASIGWTLGDGDIAGLTREDRTQGESREGQGARTDVPCGLEAAM